jgi:excinuclease ABC subunit B
MQQAIEETERRRQKQIAYNQKHGIIPKSASRALDDILEVPLPGRSAKPLKTKVAEAEAEYQVILKSPKEIAKFIQQLEERMYQHARDLEFEQAAKLRDEIAALKARLALAN